MMAKLTFSNGSGCSVELDTDVIRFSRMRRRLIVWARSINEWAKNVYLPATGHMPLIIGITLTYRENTWLPGHITNFIDHLRYHLAGKLLAYCWVAELQARGVPHYHVCLALAHDTTFQKKLTDTNVDLPFPDAAGWWKHGYTWLTWQTKLGKPLSASSRYLTKYLQKGFDSVHDFPKGMRLYGMSWPKDLPEKSEFWRKLSVAPPAVMLHIKGVMQWMGEKIVEVPGWAWERLTTGGWYVTFKKLWWHVETVWRLVSIDGEAYSSGKRRASAYMQDT